MARRLALLALLACAAIARPSRPYSAENSDSESLDPFTLWDDYEDSFETKRPTAKPGTKIILKSKLPKVNMTKNTQSDDAKKKVIKTTHINIASHTNFIVTKRPVLYNKVKKPGSIVNVGDDYVIVEASNVAASEPPKKPVTTRRPPSTRRSTTRRPPATSKRPTVRPVRTPSKTTKTPTRKKTTTCSPKNPGWLSSFFQQNKIKKPLKSASTAKKPIKKSLKKNYKGYQLLRAYPDEKKKINELLDLREEAQGSGLMWWSSPSLNGSTDLLVPPDILADIKDHLKSIKVDFDVIIWDLQKAVTYENPKLSKKQRLELEHLRGHPMTWRRYHRYADILRYLEFLQHSHSDLVELVPLGRSSEGLPLVAVKVRGR
ncbi:unnamed protein product [Diatraea saccharalis]|uniref:Peptidase M14 domain-containing protein n=1 Tax=Diatraea saccharalis TaxID=40085 RepID=A0A9N9QUQ2_9NEOP|nr:unnamed protein product [Diatraea saccharalis]